MPAPGSMRSDWPAPCSSSVTSVPRSSTAQCHQPDGVGASGSKQVTTKPRVSCGKPDQASCGETLPPAALCVAAIGRPSVRSADVTVKDGTAGSFS